MLASDRRISEDDYLRLSDLITTKSGLEFPPSRRPQFEQAVLRAVDDLCLGHPRDLWERLREEPGHVDLENLIASLTIGESYFFRNEPHFHALEHHVLPELLDRRRGTKRLRIWSAGCSSGEEPYSLAMLLDRLVPDLASWDVTIVGTDINRAALRRAEEGVYRSWSLRRIRDSARPRYFAARGEEEWELDRVIRRMVTFRYLNLVDDIYPSLFTNIHALDLVLCRNVLIYFGDSAVQTVTEKLGASVADGGWLILGQAELARVRLRGFTPRSFPGALLYRRELGSEDHATVRHTPPPPSAVAQLPRRAPVPSPPSSTTKSAVVAPPATETGVSSLYGVEIESGSDLDAATRELERKATEDPQDPGPPYLLAKLLADRLDVVAAERWIHEALHRDNLFAPAYYLAGLLAEEEGHIDDAVSALRRCIYAAPSWPLGHFALARCFLRVGRKDRAAVCLGNVVRLLQDSDAEECVFEGDGLTAGRLLELARIHAEVSGIEPWRRSSDDR